MFRYDDVWLPLQSGLSRYTGIEVIQADGMGKQPPYPFFSIKNISPAIGVGQATEYVEDNIMTIEQDVEIILSITCNAGKIEDAEDYSNKARGYFLGKGSIELSDVNIAVVEVLDANNRDVFLTVDYERRVGFDIRLRVRGRESFEVDVIKSIEATGTIENIEIKEGI
ncbi:phage neck terminator protein [Lysinibacillus sp. TE18511]